MSSTRFLYIGPERVPITGQSEAFELLHHTRTASEIFIHFPQRGLSLASIKFLSLLIWQFWSVRPQVVYLSISRSGRGFLRDACAIWLAVLFRARVVVHLHGADFSNFLATAPRKLAWAIRKSYRHVAAAIVLIDSMKIEFQAFPELKVYTIPNSVSAEVETAAASFCRQKSNPSKPLKVLFLSNLIPSKGIIELIEAVKHLRAEEVDVQLDICGSSGFSPELDIQVAQVTDGVRFHGLVMGEDKLKFLKAADVVALPTYYPTEAQPISLIEAMYFGCALLFTDHNYLLDFLSENFGMCVPPRESKAIATALRRYAEDRELLHRHGELGRQSARIRFDRASHCASVREVLRHVSRPRR